MSKKSKKNRINVVYSTNPNFEYEEEFDEVSSIPFSEQNLYVLVDRKNRGGKTVTLIEGFTGSDEDASDKVQQFLKDLGANVKFKGG